MTHKRGLTLIQTHGYRAFNEKEGYQLTHRDFRGCQVQRQNRQESGLAHGDAAAEHHRQTLRRSFSTGRISRLPCGLDKLAEVIDRRQQFEMERDNLTADTSREEVERVLWVLIKAGEPCIEKAERRKSPTCATPGADPRCACRWRNEDG